MKVIRNKQKIEDPLKPIDKIFNKDREFLGGVIEDRHSDLSSISLIDSVPKEIGQLFETAKNISLYSFFAYRLHQPAELYGYIALEQAFRIKAKELAPDLFKKVKFVTLGVIIKRAIKDKWLTEHQFEDAIEIAIMRVREKFFFEILPDFVGSEVSMLEPTSDEILKEYEEMNYVDDMLVAGKDIRNLLAHGSKGLSPSSVGTLKKTASIINALFKKK